MQALERSGEPKDGLSAILRALNALERGDHGMRLPLERPGLAGRVSDVFNDVADRNERMAEESRGVLQRKRRRILVADDNIDLATSMGLLLEMMGNDVRVTHDGTAAVSTEAEFRPDVVFLDIGMAKMNGFDACRCIRGKPWGQEPVIVALTGWGQAEDRRRSKEAGFDHHLVKPVEPAMLERFLAEIESRSA